MKNINLISYKMTNDSGFAPNPFHGFLTLANCKPGIRKSGRRKIGDWIAGFTSSELNGDSVGEERLVYLMKVTDIVTYEEYWNNPKYKVKKPKLKLARIKNKAGDNIYKPLIRNAKLPGHFKQIPNKFHFIKNKKDDLSGLNVLISKYFFYFGCKPLIIDNSIKPSIPPSQHPYGYKTKDQEIAKAFVDFVKKHPVNKVINYPIGMQDNKSKNKCR